MSNKSVDIHQKLEMLRQKFFTGLPVRLQNITQTIQSLDQQCQQDQLDTLIIALHSLAGTSATYGYLDISKHAKAAERYLREQQPPFDITTIENKINSYISAIYLDMEENNYEQLVEQMSHELSAHLLANQTSNSEVLIYVVDDDPNILNEIQTLLDNVGYRVQTYSDLSALDIALQARIPSLLIMDIVFTDDKFAGTDFVHNLRSRMDADMPVIFLSEKSDMEYRFRAQQAGGSYYLQKPLNFPELIHTIELVVSFAFEEPYRVLIIDDDPEHAAYTAHVLQQTGIHTEILLNPELTLETIKLFKPEVILLDMMMPIYNGLQLAAMIRMDPKQQFTSILFLSAETDTDKQIEAIHLGADDFLVKPVNPNILLKTVQIRARRARSYEKAFNELGHVVNELEHFKIALDQHAIVSIADIQGRITYANQKFFDISGYNHEELIGHSHNLLNSGYHPPGYFTEMWQAIVAGKTWQGDIKNRTKDGDDYWVASTITPLLDQSGRPEKYISIRTDITKLKLLTESLHISEERLRRSQEAARIGNWDWDIISGELFWSELIGPLFGYNEVVETTYDNFINAIHPDDRELVTSSVTACIEEGAIYDIEHRIIRQDGDIRWLSEKGDVIRGEDGTTLHMIGVVQDITDRKNIETDLLAAKNSAEMASRSKTEFLSRMSHELRTPLNAILGFGQLMESDPTDPLSKSHQTNVEQILTAGWHLLELINEVLDLAKIESGKLSISMEPVDAGEIIDECLKLTEQMAQQYQIEIVTTPFRNALYIHADRIRFKQVYLNLLTNAIKYNRTGGTVTLTHEILNNKHVLFNIADTGTGISAEQLPHLFEPFNRLGAENTLIEGTGIGLVIAKRLTEMMHGHIDVNSEIDAGTVFSLKFEVDDAIVDIDHAETLTQLQSLEQATNKKIFRILYVEDNPANLKLVSNILQRIPDIVLITATNGQEGLSTANDLLPDLILLDINLPGLSGIEICTALNNNSATKNIPRIAVSANAMPADIDSAMIAGFDKYLTKPLDVSNFLNVITEYITNTN
ncbi:MAG: response regulator [Gammaproteobacteria bacterium]|nr:response regulator [Gammaproteobacteria bacterium]